MNNKRPALDVVMEKGVLQSQYALATVIQLHTSDLRNCFSSATQAVCNDGAHIVVVNGLGEGGVLMPKGDDTVFEPARDCVFSATQCIRQITDVLKGNDLGFKYFVAVQGHQVAVVAPRHVFENRMALLSQSHNVKVPS